MLYNIKLEGEHCMKVKEGQLNSWWDHLWFGLCWDMLCFTRQDAIGRVMVGGQGCREHDGNTLLSESV